MPGHRTRKGVVLVLEGSPNCCQRNVSVATGIYSAFRGIGDDVSTYPVVDPIRSSGEMRHGSLPTSPPPVPRSPSECVGFPTRRTPAFRKPRRGLLLQQKSEGHQPRRMRGDRNIGLSGGDVVKWGRTKCERRAKPHGKRPPGSQRWLRKQTIPKSANTIPACAMRGPHWRKDASPSTFLT
jgi:hypothetical protein